MSSNIWKRIARGFVILWTIVVSCGASDDIANPDNIFSEAELVELDYIVDVFDRILIFEYPSEDIAKSYQNFSRIVAQQGQNPYQRGMLELSDEVATFRVYHEIWMKERERTASAFTINPDGKYINYMQKISRDQEFLKSYVDSYKMANDITPSLAAGYARYIESIDLSDKTHRLIFAIHYLTLLNR